MVKPRPTFNSSIFSENKKLIFFLEYFLQIWFILHLHIGLPILISHLWHVCSNIFSFSVYHRKKYKAFLKSTLFYVLCMNKSLLTFKTWSKLSTIKSINQHKVLNNEISLNFSSVFIIDVFLW